MKPPRASHPTRRPARGRGSYREKSHAAPPSVPPLSPAHPAMIAAMLVAAAGIVLSVSFRIQDTDFWQHLLVGKAIWTLHRVPSEHLWTWPWYGTPEVSWLGKSGWSPSWLFRALIWPLYAAGGVTGLFAWRWASTLAAFGFAWAAARRMGARGFTPLFVAVWASLLYRHRSQIRPETFAAVLMTAEMWLLAARRPAARGEPLRDPSWGLVAIAWIWANAHISYFLFFVILGLHLVDEAWRTRAFPRKLALVGVASLAACFANPYGWQVLWQPFAYFAQLREDPMLRGIGELRPLGWANNQTDGVFVMLALWPLLLLWRWRKHGFDFVESGVCAFFTWQMVSSERFFGNYALVAAVYLARDLDAWVRARAWPSWTASPAARSALASVAILLAGAAEWARADRPLSISIDMRRFPVHAMDFIERHGVGGHGFEQQRVAGYQLWRFWPQRDRLPFMDVHATATSEDRAAYAFAFTRHDGWRLLDRGQRFDYAVLDPWAADSLLEGLDTDTTMVLVFLDDTGALYVRKQGRNSAVADSFGYRMLGGGAHKNATSFVAAASPGHASERAELVSELDRMAASSPGKARASNMVGTFAIAERRFDDARVALLETMRLNPNWPLAHYRLGSLALMQRKPKEAIAEFERERAVAPRPGIDYGIGTAQRLLGNEVEARKAFEREIARWPLTPSANAAQQALLPAPTK